MEYSKWLDEWLNYYVKPNVKQSTFKKYLNLCRLHIIPLLGSFALDNISANVLQRYMSQLLEKGLAPNTVNGILSTIKLSLKQAYDAQVTKVQNTHVFIRLKVREKKIPCLSVKAQKRIERYVLKSEKPRLCGIILCLYTGMRIGELLALKWQDVDLSKGIICITKSCRDSWQNGRYIKVIDTAKTQNSMRVIPMPKQVTAYMKKIKKCVRGDYVIMGRANQGVGVRIYQKTFSNVLRRLSLPHCGFHTLRHTFATRALEIGMDVKTLAEILGHSDPTITLRRYAHSMLEYKKVVMNKLGKEVFDKRR